jgi:hypothetical protein
LLTEQPLRFLDLAALLASLLPVGDQRWANAPGGEQQRDADPVPGGYSKRQ